MLSFFHSIISLSLLCFLVTISSSTSTEFDFGTLTLSNLKLLGDAHLNNGSVRLTRDLPVPNSGAGKVLYSKPIPFRQPETRSITSFSTFFSFSVTNLNPSSIGGGLAFVISPDSEAIGAAGACLGLLNSDGLGSGFVALEFDTLMDVEFKDINGNHVGSTEIHSIEWWSFTSSFDSSFGSGSSSPPPPTTNLMNPTANSVKSPPPSLAPTGSDSITSAQEKNSKSSSSCHNQLCKQGPGAVAGVVTASAFLVIFAGVLIWVFSKKYKRVKKESFASEVIKMPKEFSYKELRSATRCFNANRIIGHGAFGTVYKGILSETGDIVAVKRCSHSSQGKTEFLSELSIIGTLRHRNLVRLQGWCHEKGEILLVYDLMPNGSLDKALFEARTPLPWPHRRKILLGVASALAYLHQECENQVIHRDIKTSNIMLDEGFNARLGDFGLARQIEHDKSPDATVAAGTMGYLAPEYLLTGRATEKTDVFSYGAVVLEVGSGRRPIEKETTGVGKVGANSNLVEWVWSLHREGRLLVAADSRLEGEFDENEMRRVLLVGLACSHPDPLARPTMRNVVQMLVGEAEVPIVPRAKPTMSFSTSHLLLSLQDSVSDCNGMITISTSSSESGFNIGGDEIV
ncbi:carbohydrate binding protein, putative [Ricinus communis]|uniref:non-specific serine/threonine protein kinase n=1 Tax=Ricinus communis TaxID=3988 RepID=B9SGP7_RICCO|nr:carbohydrate binding protein, putative [Ricinus communis]